MININRKKTKTKEWSENLRESRQKREGRKKKKRKEGKIREKRKELEEISKKR